MEKICAGIVSYNPDPERLRLNLEAIGKQAEKVFLADNGSKNFPEIQALCAGMPNVVLLRNEENLGIAAALNQACGAAKEKGYAWILTLDQDTVIEDGMIRRMSAHCAEKKNGIICPAVYYEGWKERPVPENSTQDVTACMTSASLTRISAWEKVGGFREDFFIDFVDNDFCQKLRDAGYTILRDNSCVMNHSLGEIRTISFLGLKKKNVVIHRPWRYYYMIRNNVVFIKDYARELNVPKERLKVLYIAVTGWLHNKEKRETLRNIRAGFRDAKAGRMGKRTAK